MSYTRRDFLKTTGGIAMAATLADTLHAQGEPRPEAGAKLRGLRWKRFVQGEAATGATSVAEAMREAERRAQRYYS